MNEQANAPTQSDFCAAQIRAWTKRADHLRALVARIDDACPHHKEARGVIACPCGLIVRGDDESPATAIDDEMIEALQRAIALCEVEAENWRNRSRGAAGARVQS